MWLPLPQAQCSGPKVGCDKHTRAGRSCWALCEVQQLWCRMKVQRAIVTLGLLEFLFQSLVLIQLPFSVFHITVQIKTNVEKNSSQKQVQP